MRTLTAEAGTVNLKARGRMRRARVADDIDKVAGLGRSLIGWQEAGWSDLYVRLIWDKLAPDGDNGDWMHSFVPGESVGLSVDTNVWEILDSADRKLLHGGKRGVCDPRHYLAQDLRHIASGVDVRAISAHWAPKRGGLGRSLQRKGNAVMREEIAWTVGRRKMPVILLADFNQTGHPLGTHIAGQPVRQASGRHLRGIDKVLTVAPRGYEFVLPGVGYRVTPLNSDHDAVSQDAVYRRAA